MEITMPARRKYAEFWYSCDSFPRCRVAVTCHTIDIEPAMELAGIGSNRGVPIVHVSTLSGVFRSLVESISSMAVEFARDVHGVMGTASVSGATSRCERTIARRY